MKIIFRYFEWLVMFVFSAPTLLAGQDIFEDGFEDWEPPKPIEHCGTIGLDQVWSATPAGHLVTCDVRVESQLSIDDGVIVRLQPGTSIIVGQSAPGAITIAGSTEGVSLTSASDSPSPGDWGALLIGSNGQATIDGADLSYCGDTDACLVVSGGELLRFNASSVRYSLSRGIHASGNAVLSIHDSLVADNGQHGIELVAPAILSEEGYTPTFSQNTVTGNGGRPILLPALSVGELDSSSSFTGNAQDMIVVGGSTLLQDTLWQALDAPYLVTGDILVQGALGPELSIAAGVAMYFESGAEMAVGEAFPGGLSVNGDPGLPVLFSGTSSSPGAWAGIRLASNCTSVLMQYATIEYGGSNNFGNLVWQSCDGTIQHATVAHSASWGIYRDDASPTITDITYIDNALGELYP